MNPPQMTSLHFTSFTKFGSDEQKVCSLLLFSFFTLRAVAKCRRRVERYRPLAVALAD